MVGDSEIMAAAFNNARERADEHNKVRELAQKKVLGDYQQYILSGIHTLKAQGRVFINAGLSQADQVFVPADRATEVFLDRCNMYPDQAMEWALEFYRGLVEQADRAIQAIVSAEAVAQHILAKTNAYSGISTSNPSINALHAIRDTYNRASGPETSAVEQTVVFL